MKERLDKLVVRRRLLESREKAKAYILAGSISVNGETVRSPSSMVNTDADIDIRVERGGYVSRGGVKLEKALRTFDLDVRGAACIDIGASTGGFTDCLLQHGAFTVLAVDVGRNQIAYALRNDTRVQLVEGFNARYIDRLEVERLPDVVTIDVSFISIRYILKPLRALATSETDVIVLVKPQFELEKPYPGFLGVVEGEERHRSILRLLHVFFLGSGYGVLGYTFSPIRGPKGNIEYFAHLRPDKPSNVTEERVAEVVTESYNYFIEAWRDGND